VINMTDGRKPNRLLARTPKRGGSSYGSPRARTCMRSLPNVPRGTLRRAFLSEGEGDVSPCIITADYRVQVYQRGSLRGISSAGFPQVCLELWISKARTRRSKTDRAGQTRICEARDNRSRSVERCPLDPLA